MATTVKLKGDTIVEMVGDPKKSVKNGGAILGQGGQGTVYKVKNTKNGKLMALKTYLTPMSNEFISNLDNNIAKGAPNDSFLWPQAITEPLGPNKDRYGYLMDIYDNKKYTTFVKVLKNAVKFPSKEKQIATLIDLVDAFEELHANGYSYQDLNDGGILIDCQEGKVLICDNDNVAPSGVNIPMDNQGHFIQGKFKYMAPEIAIRMFQPDKHSDRFSLAVLMFMLLTHAHPYDGAMRLSGALTPALQEQVYGTQPVFIFHPTDKSNRPDPQLDANAIKAWPTLPDFIQDLFIKTFTSGMPAIGKKREDLNNERQGRASEKEWREALHRWLDTASSCPKCNHAVCAPLNGTKLLPMKCPHCGKKITVERPIIEVKKNGKVVRTIVLEVDKVVPKSSVTKEKSNDPAFYVIQSKKNKDAFAIVNCLKDPWKCTQQGAKTRIVGKDEKVAAFNGVHIEFDYTFSGDIYYTKF